MTDAQNDALNQIRKLMREHFDASIFIWENEDENTAMGWETSYTTAGGGFAASLGLVRYAEHQILNPQSE